MEKEILTFEKIKKDLMEQRKDMYKGGGGMKRIISIVMVLVLAFCATGCDHQNSLLNDEKLAEIVAKNLGVPDSANVEFEVSETFYWEAGGRDFKNVTFTENGEEVAYAAVDPFTGELLKDITNMRF